MDGRGRVAHPFGIKPEPPSWSGDTIQGYNGDPDRDILERLNRWLAVGSWEVHIARTFDLAEAPAAHDMLTHHYLGKLALRVH